MSVSYSNNRSLTFYEKQQLNAIEKWKTEEPSIIQQAVGKVFEPVSKIVNVIVPEKAIQGALDGASELGRWLADYNDLQRDGEVENIKELRTKDLGVSDKLADEVHNWAIGIATAEGGATGFFGVFGMAADIPSVVTLALRTIHKIGLCYGYECKTEEEKNFVLAILSVSSANSMEEKTTALATLKVIQNIISRKTWKKIGEIAVKNPAGIHAAITLIRNLAKQLGINITKRKALQAVPFIGAAVGGAVNGAFIKDVGWTARRAFQERWLKENGKIIDVEVVK
ncbi:EcsC family protein [Bacillus sp. HNR-4]|uniref:EcsC family protein n=1 Tax=Bacillus sp. HNR-4 TaxID=2796141 RepID=UPI0027AA7DC3|nr:EcsC family protein [Bacillus sp. HNR-4]